MDNSVPIKPFSFPFIQWQIFTNNDLLSREEGVILWNIMYPYTEMIRQRVQLISPFVQYHALRLLPWPGDTVIVHAGVYREWVNPANGGTAEHRIVYRSAGDGEVVITGAERITDWKSEGDDVWSTEVPNSIFSVRNPFEVELSGDWLFDGPFPIHLGDVYLDGKSLYECDSVGKVHNPEVWPEAKYPKDSLLQMVCRSWSCNNENLGQFWRKRSS